jgi:tRNA dimethylallyltransferase
VRRPIAKVHGLRELAAFLQGRLGEDAARASVVSQIRQYARRQRTWFRHQLPELQPITALGEDAAARGAVLRLLRAGADGSTS